MLSHAERRVAVISPPIYRQRETQKIRLIPPVQDRPVPLV
jgi:hypothetical protein